MQREYSYWELATSCPLLFIQEREKKTTDKLCLKERLEQAKFKRQNHLDAMTSHLRHNNLRASEVRALTKERNRKYVEELSKIFHDKLNEASFRHQDHLATIQSRLRHQAMRAAEQRILVQKRMREAAEELSKKLKKKLEQASLKRQERFNALKNGLEVKFIRASVVKQRRAEKQLSSGPKIDVNQKLEDTSSEPVHVLCPSAGTITDKNNGESCSQEDSKADTTLDSISSFGSSSASPAIDGQERLLVAATVESISVKRLSNYLAKPSKIEGIDLSVGGNTIEINTLCESTAPGDDVTFASTPSVTADVKVGKDISDAPVLEGIVCQKC